MIEFTYPAQVIWRKFTDYYKICDISAPNGAAYGLVFSEERPKSYQLPCEFEECVYIGESSGLYIDKQGGKGKLRSHVHKRMTKHNNPLINGVVKKKDQSGYKDIIEHYGFGTTVVDGIVTGKPLWLGLLIPRKDLPDYAFKAWVQNQEREQIFYYIMKFGRSPLGNKDCDKRPNPNSWSTKALKKMGTLDV